MLNPECLAIGMLPGAKQHHGSDFTDWTIPCIVELSVFIQGTVNPKKYNGILLDAPRIHNGWYISNRWSLRSNAAKHNQLGVHVFLDAMWTLPTKTAFFDTAKWDGGLRKNTNVRPNHTNLKSLSNPPHSTNVSREEIPSEPNIGAVGQFNDLFFSLKSSKCCNWTKSFFIVESGFAGHVGEDGGVEKGCIGNVPATNENLSTLAHGVFNVPDYFLNCTCTVSAVLNYQVKETTAKKQGYLHSLLKTITDSKFGNAIGKTWGKICIYRGLDEDPVGTNAGLTATSEFTKESS